MKKNFIKFLLFYLFVKLVFWLGSLFLNFPIIKIFSLESAFVSDASFNDLHYYVNKEKQDLTLLGGKVLIINSGSIGKDSFRTDLARLLRILQAYKPAIIGIDHDFRNEPESGTDELKREIAGNSNILLPNEASSFISGATYGKIQFPDNQITIRKYASDTTTFGYKIAEKISPDEIQPFPHEHFFINYIGTYQEIVTKAETDHFRFYEPGEETVFLNLEASDLLAGDSISLDKLKRLASGRALLIGNLGSSALKNWRYDIEDKHRVPFDTVRVDRERTMPGVLIHANAIENILNPSVRFQCFSNSLLFDIIKEIVFILFLFYLFFHNKGKAFNILFLVLLTFPIIAVVLYLMRHNIYIEIGLTLLFFLLLEELYEIFESIYPRFLLSERKKK